MEGLVWRGEKCGNPGSASGDVASGTVKPPKHASLPLGQDHAFFIFVILFFGMVGAGTSGDERLATTGARRKLGRGLWWQPVGLPPTAAARCGKLG